MKSNCIFICGNDDFLINFKAEHIFTKYENSYFKEIINSKIYENSDLHQILKNIEDSVYIKSLFYKKKIIWIKGINFFEKNNLVTSFEVTKFINQFQKIIQKIEPQNKIIISIDQVDEKQAYLNWFKQNTNFIYIKEEKDNILMQRLLDIQCNDFHITMEESAKYNLIQRCGKKNILIYNEFLKLATYVGPKNNINYDIVNILVKDINEYNIFDVAESFFVDPIHTSLKNLNLYLDEKNEKKSLIFILQNYNRLMIQIKVLLNIKKIFLNEDNNLNRIAFENAKTIFLNQDMKKNSFNVFTQDFWYINKLSKLAQKFSISKLINLQFSLLKAFEKIIVFNNKESLVLKNLFLSFLSNCC